jgi:hypothetical protein
MKRRSAAHCVILEVDDGTLVAVDGIEDRRSATNERRTPVAGIVAALRILDLHYVGTEIGGICPANSPATLVPISTTTSPLNGRADGISGDLFAWAGAAELCDGNEPIEPLQLLEQIARLALVHVLRRAVPELAPQPRRIDGTLEVAARLGDRLGRKLAPITQ